MLRTSLAACAFLLFIGATSIYSTVPNSVNYQGRLTDATGAPVPDGSILVKFTIYDAATAGTALWNSGFQTVTTTDGLFNYDLGSNVALPDLFSTDSIRYLGILVNTDPEISPRTRFNSSGYAYQSQKSVLALDADSLGGLQPAFYLDWANMTNIPAGFADGVDDVGIDQATADGRYLLETGDTLKGNLEFDTNNNGVSDGGLKSSATGTNLELADAGNVKSKVWGDSFGEVDLYDVDGDLTVFMQAQTLGGRLLLRDGTGTNSISLLGSTSGDGSVVLPNDAINSTEMLNEPGIASHTSIDFSDLNTTSTTELDSVTITIPSPGYIVVMAKAVADLFSTSGSIFEVFQIDEDPISNTFFLAHNVRVGSLGFITEELPVSLHRVYFKVAGTYTFYLEAQAELLPTGGSARAGWPKITAMYFPTSYGPVTTLAPSIPGDNPTAKAVSVTNPDGTVTTGYEMDLRYYEEKARQAEIAKQKAELEALQAKTDLERARQVSNQE